MKKLILISSILAAILGSYTMANETNLNSFPALKGSQSIEAGAVVSIVTNSFEMIKVFKENGHQEDADLVFKFLNIFSEPTDDGRDPVLSNQEKSELIKLYEEFGNLKQ